MKKLLKRTAVFLFTGILTTEMIFAGPAEGLQQITLENGMEAFILENPADAVVNIEFECRAGFSSQTQETNGFFKLFTRLIAAANPELDFSDISCQADSSRYSLTTSPALVEKTLQAMADAFFNPQFSEEVLSAEFNKLKKETAENAETMSYYINAAIDSRVFSESPWKHDSGIYPPLFNKTSQKQARTILNQIAERWYIPQNCALFISGNVNSERLEIMLKNSFGRFYSARPVPQQKPNIPLNSHKKYVFHSKEISPDLTQLVIQYTMLSRKECNLLATMLNSNDSKFKTNLVDNARLNIPGDEYINASAIHEKGNSRLIIQTLLQKPEDRKIQVSSKEQAEEFIAAVTGRGIADFADEGEFLLAKTALKQEEEDSASNVRDYMKKMADLWADEAYYGNQDEEITLQECLSALSAEEPFVFVIINSEDYRKSQKEYSAGDFQEINEGNSSWYIQELFKEVRKTATTEELPEYITTARDLEDNGYTQQNLSLINQSELSNGIKVISKSNSLSTRTTMLISIKGGKYNTSENHGFEEVMIQLLSGMIQRELSAKNKEGLITYLPHVSAKSDFATSSITIEFLEEDSEAVCRAIVNSIIYGEIPPAMADRAVGARQYRKRLENGSAPNQIFYGAIEEIYRGSSIINLFETEKDVLQNTDYNSILTAYPEFLDARRYSLILTGKTDEKMIDVLERSFGQLSRTGKNLQPIKAKSSLQKGKVKTVSLVHTFLTDIPAEEAGPMPAELIPTTEFLDPVAYIYKAPDSAADTKTTALFKALLNYLADFLQEKCAENGRLIEADVSVIQPRNSQPFGTIIFQNVRHTKEADSLLRGSIAELKKLLSTPATAQKTLLAIKNCWNLKQMNLTGTDAGTAALLQKGIELSPENPLPSLYLTEYDFIQTSDARDYLEALKDFSDKPNLSVYSLDSKK
ncbi:MAG: insulinase family protein [Treponema sp.]|nr:insulinase family protein [Treponema sp.]